MKKKVQPKSGGTKTIEPPKKKTKTKEVKKDG